MTSESQYRLESLERAIRVLECFAKGNPELRIVDISRDLNISKVQALRITKTLESQGLLIRDARTKYYRLGLRIFQLGMLVQQQSELQRIAHPFLQELVAQSGETARLVVADQRGPTCLDLVESPRRYKVFGKMGGPLPWHAGTSTKLLLAYQSDDFIDSVLSGPLPKYTSLTTTDPSELREQLRTIRRQGFHISAGDIEEGAIAISTPILDRCSEVVGAISVSGPTSRVQRLGEESLLRWVSIATDDISRSVGYAGPSEVGQAQL